MPAVPHGRFVAPGFPSASSDGFFFNPSFQPTDPPVFDHGQQFAKTFLELHRSGRLSGLPAGKTHPNASRRSPGASDFGVSTEPNPGEVLLRMDAARKRLAPTSTLAEFAMRARADGGVGAGADPSVGEFLIRLGRAQEQAAAGEGAEAGAFTTHADAEAGVGAGPELGLALLRFASSDGRLAPTDGRKAPSIPPPAATPVSSNGRLPNSGTENWPRVPGSYDPNIDASPVRREEQTFIDRFNRGARYYLGPHATQGLTNVLTLGAGLGAGAGARIAARRMAPSVRRGLQSAGQILTQAGKRIDELPEFPHIPPRRRPTENQPDETHPRQEEPSPQAEEAPALAEPEKRRSALPQSDDLIMHKGVKTNDHRKPVNRNNDPDFDPENPSGEFLIHRATIGESELKITIDVDRGAQSAGTRDPSEPNDMTVAIVGFGGNDDDQQTLDSERTMNKDFYAIFATVHNKVVEFVRDEAPRGQPMEINFEPATRRLEETYRKFGPHIADAFGAEFDIKEPSASDIEKAEADGEPKPVPKFRYLFPRGYVLPKQRFEIQ